MFAGKGDLFGCDFIIGGELSSKTNCDVKSLTYSEVHYVLLQDMSHVFSCYPDFAKQFQENLVQSLTYNLREDYVDPDVSETKYKSTAAKHSFNRV